MIKVLYNSERRRKAFITKELKQKNYKGHIVTFFHNVEKFFCKRSFVKRLLYPVYNGPLIRSETNAIMYSDDIVTLTERDAAYVKRVNNRSKVTILPSSMEDKMENVNGYVAQTLLVKVKCPQLLFVGSYFYANVNGLSWFIERILPQVNAKLIVVGANMYNPQIQISAESETKRSIFREKDKTKRSKKESAQHSKSRNKSFVMTSVSAL